MDLEIVRDERWENVEAHVGFPQGYIYEGDDSDFYVDKIVEFFIEVRLGKQVYYSKMLVHKEDLEEARLRFYQFTLDKMVEQIDDYIEKTLKEES